MNAKISAIFNEIGAGLLRFIQAKIPHRETAEDIFQDIFVKVHARLHTLGDESKLTSWIFQIARNSITDYYRMRKTTLPLPEEIAEEINDAGITAIHRFVEEGMRILVSLLPDESREALLAMNLMDTPLPISRKKRAFRFLVRNRGFSGREPCSRTLYWNFVILNSTGMARSSMRSRKNAIIVKS